ncbi:uncharacterized protein BP5553_09729 [Venustampulla echinocandica]|uniref:RRM domain-containing protein n=1 Tax=Venustampulla echinocandica TaxID=2656787 RepID=A0A370TBU7_9HELO|nr:uncharacterized protein BP5553_09729 [Venustampulla echinocandica]RDL31520.1 hypothetical protein BP5553_09729 [Venustampulla echinocandica]
MGGASSAKGKGKETTPIAQFGSLTINDEAGVSVKAEASGSYSSDPAKAKEVKGFSPSSERYQAKFIKGETGLDDPFDSTARNVGPLVGKRRAMSDNWRSGSSSASDGSSPPLGKSESAPGSIAIASTNVERAVANVPDLTVASQPIVTNQNAQNQFPIECCVFVANLLQSESEENLQASLTRVFRQYGPVWVNVKRDKNKMPFAFCTFSLPEHAEHAISDGHGRYINGRPCRCEQARGHRAGFFYLGRRFGSVITHDEAMDLLISYGEIKSCRTATDIDRACFNLNEGVLVEFSMYPQGQAALAAFRNHNVYKMLDLADIDSPIRRRVHTTTSASQARAYNSAYEHERSTVFVGNLPGNISEQQIQELFGEYGSIVEITIRECNSKFNPDQRLCLAFIKYTSPVAVSQAIQGKHGFAMGSNRLRVAPKNSERNTRHSPPSSTRFRSTPARREPSMTSMAQMTPSPQDAYQSGYAHQQALSTSAPIYGQQHGSFPNGYTHQPSAYAVTPQHPSYGYPVQQPPPIYGAQYFDGTQYYAGGVPVYGTPISPYYYQANTGYPALPQYPYSPYNSTVVQQSMISPPATQHPSGYPMTGNSDQDDGSTTPTRHGYASAWCTFFTSLHDVVELLQFAHYLASSNQIITAFHEDTLTVLVGVFGETIWCHNLVNFNIANKLCISFVNHSALPQPMIVTGEVLNFFSSLIDHVASVTLI